MDVYFERVGVCLFWAVCVQVKLSSFYLPINFKDLFTLQQQFQKFSSSDP